jgi:C4-dicarboxylate transporter, DctQ subunit
MKAQFKTGFWGVFNNIESYTAIPMQVGLVFILTINMFYRYFIGHSVPWAEEISRLIFIALVYISVGYASVRNRHIRITMQLGLLGKKGRIIFLTIADSIWLIYNAVIIVKGIQIMHEMLIFKFNSPVLDIPMYISYAFIPIGFTFMTIRVVQNMIRRISLGESEETALID